MYDNFDSFFEAFKAKMYAMSDEEFLRFLEIPKQALTTFPVTPITSVFPNDYNYSREFANGKTIAMCA